MRITPLAPMLEARSHFGFAEHGGKLYVFGGGGENFQSLASTEVYDPATDSWAARAPMGEPRSGIVAVTVGDRIFVCGGGFKKPDGTFDFKSKVEIYLPGEDRWETGPSMIMRHDAPAAVALGDVIYLFGGHHPDASGGPLTDPAFDFCEQLDLEKGVWEEIDPLPTSRFSLAAVNMADGIWVMGGGAFLDESFNNMATIEVYDPYADVWGKAPTMLPWPTAGLYACVHEGALYVAGGNDGDGISARLARYMNGEWETLPDLPEGRVMGVMASVGGKLILAGGRTPDGKTVTGTAYLLTP